MEDFTGEGEMEKGWGRGETRDRRRWVGLFSLLVCMPEKMSIQRLPPPPPPPPAWLQRVWAGAQGKGTERVAFAST